MELCSPQFWFISLGKQLRLLVPASEQQQAFDVLREAVENASALALDPIRDGEEFPEEEPVEIEFDRSGLRFFFIYAGFIIALFVLYWVLHVAGATL
jgi:hypothetical protein